MVHRVLATPRTLERLPSQRFLPALPIEIAVLGVAHFSDRGEAAAVHQAPGSTGAAA
jgi:hypothetical protein